MSLQIGLMPDSGNGPGSERSYGKVSTSLTMQNLDMPKAPHPAAHTTPANDTDQALVAAAQLFSEGTVSLGKAARLSGHPVEAFIEYLGAMGIAAVNYPADELDAELKCLNVGQPAGIAAATDAP